MKYSGTRKAMQTPIGRSICAMLCLLLLLPAIALYPMLHASAEKDGVDSSTAIQAVSYTHLTLPTIA